MEVLAVSTLTGNISKEANILCIPCIPLSIEYPSSRSDSPPSNTMVGILSDFVIFLNDFSINGFSIVNGALNILANAKGIAALDRINFG